jgi:hypothetical protein
VQSNFTAAFAGTNVTITAVEGPKGIFADGSLEARTISNVTAADGPGTSHTFTMPAEDVDVSAVFLRPVRYVRQGGAGTKDGTSWENASDDLQEMMDEHWLQSTDYPDYTYVVRVGAGTYKPQWLPGDLPGTHTPGNQDSAFILRKGVQVRGGYAAGGEDINETERKGRFNADGTVKLPIHKAVLSGDLNDSNSIDTNDANHVVLGLNIPVDSGTVLDGLTITGGNATWGGSISVDSVSFNQRYGSGMYNINSSPALENVMISGNAASEHGGGMYNVNSSPVLINVTISGNTARYFGGGIYNNQDSSPVLVNVKISGNHATYGGTGDGGGIYNTGGGCNPVLLNVLISGNRAARNGGGIHNTDSSFPILINVTVAGNFADSGGGASLNTAWPEFYNSIICGNTANDANKDIGVYWGGSTALYNSIRDSNPQFVTPLTSTPESGGDYSLQSGSPAINTGLDTHYPIDSNGGWNAASPVYSTLSGLPADIQEKVRLALTKDLGGVDNRFNGIIDMGAYEY